LLGEGNIIAISKKILGLQAPLSFFQGEGIGGEVFEVINLQNQKRVNWNQLKVKQV